MTLAIDPFLTQGCTHGSRGISFCALMGNALPFGLCRLCPAVVESTVHCIDTMRGATSIGACGAESGHWHEQSSVLILVQENCSCKAAAKQAGGKQHTLSANRLGCWLICTRQHVRLPSSIITPCTWQATCLHAYSKHC